MFAQAKVVVSAVDSLAPKVLLALPGDSLPNPSYPLVALGAASISDNVI